MHINCRLRQRTVREQLVDPGQRFTLGIRQLETEMTADVPIGKQVHFPLQQRPVIGWQNVRAARPLPGHQRGNGVAEQCIRIFFGERLQVGGIAEVRQQHETLRGIGSQDFGHMHTGITHQLRDMDERPAVFTLGRRIHGNARHAVQRHPEITPEAGIRRGRRERKGRAGQLRGDPSTQRFAPQIVSGVR